ncbi:MAG: DUF2946 family protein [Pseudomonadota bacterium]
MNTRRVHLAGRLLAALAICLQVHLPAAMSIAGPGESASYLFCAPSGPLTAEAKAALSAFLSAAGKEAPDERDFGPHCPHCTLTGAATLPEQRALGLPATRFDGDVAAAVRDRGLVPQPQGPPIGPRGPPVTL